MILGGKFFVFWEIFILRDFLINVTFVDVKKELRYVCNYEVIFVVLDNICVVEIFFRGCEDV